LAETVPQSFRYSCAWELTPHKLLLLIQMDYDSDRNVGAVWREPDSACRHADQTISSPRDR